MKLSGEVGYSDRRKLRARVMKALRRGDGKVVVDCSEWMQLDLILLSALVDCAKRCAEHRAEFELANLPADMRSRIEALRLATRLGLCS